jgi:hypothetical protein
MGAGASLKSRAQGWRLAKGGGAGQEPIANPTLPEEPTTPGLGGKLAPKASKANLNVMISIRLRLKRLRF